MKTIDAITSLAYIDREPTELSEEALAALHRLAAYTHYAVTAIYQWRNESPDEETGEITLVV